MPTTAWKLGDTGYYFERRQDAVDTIRNTWSNSPDVRVLDQAYSPNPAFSKVLVEEKGEVVLTYIVQKVDIHAKAIHL